MTKLRLSRTLLPEKRLAVLCAVPAVLVVLALMTLLAGCSDKEPWKNLSQEQKIEDFEYLFDILEYNHSYLALKVRTDGYDWLAHRDEFEQAVRDAADDKAFAQAIARMLRQINNGHTGMFLSRPEGGNGMRITVGVDDYRRCVDAVPEKGKWQAWLDEYYSKFRHVFDPMVKYLYMADSVESLRPYVEAWDFEAGLRAAERFISARGVDRVKELASRSAEILDFHEDCDVFLMVGIGQVGGTALPAEKSFVYFGTELFADKLDRLAFMVPHEFMHTVRRGGFNPATLTFGHLVVEEGIATVFSIVAQDLPLDNPNLKAALPFMSDEAFAYCEGNRKALTREIFSQAASPVTPELAAKYLYSGPRCDERGVPGSVGYYVGARAVIDLLKEGRAVKELSRLPAQEVIDAVLRRYC
ncbi:MAG: hypothetical protein ACOX5Q_05690 [Bacillota bacterium]